MPKPRIDYQKERGERQESRILATLANGPTSAMQLMLALSCSRNTVAIYLRRLRAAKRIHVSGFESSHGRPTPLYAIGNAPDQPYSKPVKLTRVERRLASVRVILSHPQNAASVALKLGLSLTMARTYIRTLRDAREVYIGSWVNLHGMGDLTPFYALGSKPDAPKPTQTRADRFKRDKADPDKYDRLLAKRRAHYRAAAAKAKPNSWLGALM